MNCSWVSTPDTTEKSRYLSGQPRGGNKCAADPGATPVSPCRLPRELYGQHAGPRLNMQGFKKEKKARTTHHEGLCNPCLSSSDTIPRLPSTVLPRPFFDSRRKSRQERELCEPYVMIPSWSHSWAPALPSPSFSLYPSRSVMNSSQCLVTSSLLLACFGRGPCPSTTNKLSFLLWRPADRRGTKLPFVLERLLFGPAQQCLPGTTQVSPFPWPAGLWQWPFAPPSASST